jgi:hypothetical protein
MVVNIVKTSSWTLVVFAVCCWLLRSESREVVWVLNASQAPTQALVTDISCSKHSICTDALRLLPLTRTLIPRGGGHFVVGLGFGLCRFWLHTLVISDRVADDLLA